MQNKEGPVDPSGAEGSEAISLEEFCSLGNRLLEQNLYEEAVSLYQTASKIFPESLVIRLNLGRAQELLHRHAQEVNQEIKDDFARRYEEKDVLSQHYLSLATMYYARKKTLPAMELLELAKLQNGTVAKARFLLAKIYYDQGDSVKALQEFLRAEELDPFNEDIYKHLGNIYFDRRQYEASLESFISAYVLSGGEDIARTSYYQRQIRLALNELDVVDKKSFYNRAFHEKRNYFLSLANSLTVRKEEAFTGTGDDLEPILLRFRETERVSQNFEQLLAELYELPVTQGFSEEEFRNLARISYYRNFQPGEVIFREDDMTEAIYFIRKGSVRIVKSTPYGEQPLASLTSPDFFGEMDFIDSLRCSADAAANEETTLLCIPKAKLEDIFISHRHIAVQFYWHFWRTLTQRIREANEILKSFFIEAAKVDRKVEMTLDTGESVSVDFEKKMAVLRDKGLSSKELRLLATFSKEEMFKMGQSIFREGQKGDRLYIILDGEVRISKFIPGAGEEALAILHKGDFFGEMALIDNQPRSADAKAHTDVTVLPIEQSLLANILSRDVESGYQFLYILSKILSRRLREINLKIYQWRIMSGGF